MNCAECKEKLVEYTEGLLEDNQEKQIQEHLAKCTGCQAELNELNELQANLKESSEQFKQVALENKVADRIIRRQNQKLKQSRRDYRHIQIWRIIMNSKITKLATAAAVILVAAVIFSLFVGPTSVVLADVVEKVKQFDKIIQRENRIITVVGQDQPFMITDVKKYVSTEHGAVEEQYDQNGNLITTVYLLKEKQQIITVLHPPKKYFIIPLDNTALELQEGFNAKGYVEWIVSESNPVRLGQKEINGRKAEGFETVNPKAMAEMAKVSKGMFPIGDNTWRLWVDVETKLPIKVEADFIMKKGPLTNFTDVHTKSETSSIEWGAEFDDSIFIPNIPDDYTELDISAFNK
ncbi:MAG: zf-HC2 domain-containing protein [Sedimentisphaerales bacterium]|nr:zf-HC2 domain-containing protein [Sedimentisphaerales bacterium]